jgi:hypothetical protein
MDNVFVGWAVPTATVNIETKAVDCERPAYGARERTLRRSNDA